MSQFSGIGRRSATSLSSTWPLGGRIWLNGALVKAEKRALWLTGSLDLSNSGWSWIIAVTEGRDSQFFLSMTARGARARRSLAASGVAPCGLARVPDPWRA